MNLKTRQTIIGIVASLAVIALSTFAAQQPGSFQRNGFSNRSRTTFNRSSTFTQSAGTNEGFDLEIFVDRNIFDPRRVKVIRGRQEPPPVIETFALTGTANSDEEGLRAFFDGNNQNYRKVLQPGGKIDGYTVAEITHESVKLVSDTNQVVLKVGMQMRRTGNGAWFPSESSSSSFASMSGGSRSFGFNDRNSRSRDSGGRNNDFAGGNFRTTRSYQGFDNGGTGASLPDVPPAVISGDPNDPVTRMMLRRQQEVGGNQNQDEPQPGDQIVPADTNTDSGGPAQVATPEQGAPDQRNTGTPPDQSNTPPPDNPGGN